MKTILLKTNIEVKMLEFEDSLEFYYKSIGCDLIDIVQAFKLNELGDKYKNFILIVDDEGLLKSDAKINTHATLLYGDVIAGNVLVCKEKETHAGYITVGLDEDDVKLFNDGMLQLIDEYFKN